MSAGWCRAYDQYVRPISTISAIRLPDRSRLFAESVLQPPPFAAAPHSDRSGTSSRRHRHIIQTPIRNNRTSLGKARPDILHL
jgi:hypothetical protein